MEEMGFYFSGQRTLEYKFHLHYLYCVLLSLSFSSTWFPSVAFDPVPQKTL